MNYLERNFGLHEADSPREFENWTKVSQVVIAAGGKGKRISPELNPNGSKVLIEHQGKTLFEYQLDSLIAGGIEKFLISTAYHTDRKVRDVVYSKGIDATVIPISEMGSFRWIPYYLQDLLDDRFLFTCGHQPLDADFVKGMLDMSTKSKFVASAYQAELFVAERARNMKIIYNVNQERVEVDNVGIENSDTQKLFIDSPYVLSKDVVFEFTDNSGQGEYSAYILNRYSTGESLSVVPSLLPPEFDFNEELERTIGRLK